MVQAEPQPMQQAPARAPQEVRTPLPPQTIAPGQQGSSTPQQAAPPAAGTPAPAAPAPRPSAAGPYVRADIGWSWARNADFADDAAVSPTCFIAVNYPGVCGASLNSLGSSAIFGVGAGYRFGNGFRADVTLEYRGGYNLSGSDPEGTYFDPQVTSKGALINGYYDLPLVLGPFRPYVGGGIGYSKNKMDPINWYDSTSSGTLPGGSTNSVAWQLTLGTNIDLGDKWVIDVRYRYSDFGRFKKDAGPDLAGQFNPPPNGTGPATGYLRASEVIVGVRRDF
jgi:opacity protein-like surface antigen